MNIWGREAGVMRKSEDNLWKLFHHVHPSIWRRLSGFSGKCLFYLSHLSHPDYGKWSVCISEWIQILLLSLCVLSLCFVTIQRIVSSFHLKHFETEKVMCTEKCEAKYKKDSGDPCKLAPLIYLKTKPNQTTSSAFPFPPHRIKGGVHIVSVLTTISLIIIITKLYLLYTNS